MPSVSRKISYAPRPQKEGRCCSLLVAGVASLIFLPRFARRHRALTRALIVTRWNNRRPEEAPRAAGLREDDPTRREPRRGVGRGERRPPRRVVALDRSRGP